MRGPRKFRVAVAIFLSVLSLTFATLVEAPAAYAGCSANIANTLLYVPVGTSFTTVSYPNSFFLNTSVIFNPASGNYYADTWSSGEDVYGSTQYMYFSYHKVSNAGNAYFQVTHC